MKGPFVPHILENQLRFFRCLLTLVPGAIALSICLLLARSSQLHEVLLRAFEGSPTRDILGLVVFAVLCLLLGAWDYQLSTSTKDLEYSGHANPYLDKLLGRGIAIKSALIAMLPFAGFILGLLAAWRLQSVPDLPTIKRLAADPLIGEFTRSTLTYARPERYWVIIGTAACLLIVSAAMILVVHRTRIRLLKWLLLFNLSLGAVTIFVAWLVPEFLTLSANTIGALPVVSLITMGILTLIFLFTFLAQNRISVVASLVSVGLVVAAASIPRATERKEAAPPAQAASPGEDPALPVAGGGELRRAFEEWLKARGIGQSSTRREPVFIFAMPGGGIYAASAAATLLATMQDRCPGFSRHVFAVSGVSGGAVGSAIFNSILASLPPPKVRGCDVLQTQERSVHVELVKHVVRSDHLAPVGAFFLPDLLRKIPGLLGVAPLTPGFDRARALEFSLEKALAELRLGEQVIPAAAAASASFASHWLAGSHVPALVLNTTWVETGHRVAFAPFPLKHVGDGTLYSFKDELFRSSPQVNAMTVLQAGVVSARFPGTSPAWQLADLAVKYRVRGSTEQRAELRTWNFVDGGYADNSGTLTAYDMYAELRRYIEEKKLHQSIDLRLIALSEEELDRLPDGTRYTDTIAPISALLNVRNRGLVEVVGKFAAQDPELVKNPDAHITARTGNRSSLLVMRLNQDEFPLTLGWTISEFRNSTIRLQLGAPELCQSDAVSKDQAKDTILGNSCIQREIFRLLATK